MNQTRSFTPSATSSGRSPGPAGNCPRGVPASHPAPHIPSAPVIASPQRTQSTQREEGGNLRSVASPVFPFPKTLCHGDRSLPGRAINSRGLPANQKFLFPSPSVPSVPSVVPRNQPRRNPPVPAHPRNQRNPASHPSLHSRREEPELSVDRGAGPREKVRTWIRGRSGVLEPFGGCVGPFAQDGQILRRQSRLPVNQEVGGHGHFSLRGFFHDLLAHR